MSCVTPALLQRYGVAMTLTALVVLLRPLSEMFLGRDLLQLWFLGAVLLGAWSGGVETGLLTASLAVLALAIAWLPPLSRPIPAVDLAILWPQGALLSWLSASWRGRRSRVENPEVRTRDFQTTSASPELPRPILVESPRPD